MCFGLLHVTAIVIFDFKSQTRWNNCVLCGIQRAYFSTSVSCLFAYTPKESLSKSFTLSSVADLPKPFPLELQTASSNNLHHSQMDIFFDGSLPHSIRIFSAPQPQISILIPPSSLHLKRYFPQLRWQRHWWQVQGTQVAQFQTLSCYLSEYLCFPSLCFSVHEHCFIKIFYVSCVHTEARLVVNVGCLCRLLT